MDKELFDKETTEKLQYVAAVSGSSFSQIAKAFEQFFAALSESLKDIFKGH